ncbi:MAG TPA: hypothetical protein VJQ09_02065 [Candidatus Limnocylindria bacterium]|nr:hypothetical protein [Candidatus Limnocylindria bacterium]
MSLQPAGFIPLPGGAGTGFDHADTYLDPTGSRLFVAHTATNAVDIIDCATNAYLRSLPDLPGVAGVLIDSDDDLLLTSDRAGARVSMFRASDGSMRAAVGVGPRPNGLAYDAKRRRVYSFNLGEPPGTGCTASVVAIDDARVIRTIDLPGRPRWAVFDRDADRVYVNIQVPAVVLRIDAGTLREDGRIDVGCGGPHGLALIDGRLFCAADGGELVVIELRGAAPRVMRRLPLPGVPDVVMSDAALGRLYVAIGTPGVVTAFDISRLAELETVPTDPGAHTIGWDPASARLYAFAPARGGALVFHDAP